MAREVIRLAPKMNIDFIFPPFLPGRMISCRRYRRNGGLKAAMGVIIYFLDAEITNLLKAWSAGDPAALDQLSKQVYDELRRMARRHMKGERRDRTLQTT